MMILVIQHNEHVIQQQHVQIGAHAHQTDIKQEHVHSKMAVQRTMTPAKLQNKAVIQQQHVQTGAHALQVEHKQEHVHIRMLEYHILTQVIQLLKAVHIAIHQKVML